MTYSASTSCAYSSVQLNDENNAKENASTYTRDTCAKFMTYGSVVSVISVILNFVFAAICVFIYQKMNDNLSQADVEGSRKQEHTGRSSQFYTETRYDTECYFNCTEAYRYPGKEQRWVPHEEKDHRFSKSVPNSLCVKILTDGRYHVYNKITLKYTNSYTMFHNLELRHPNGSAHILDNNNFQWNPPQTGRTPSTIQTVSAVQAAKGDNFCVHTLKDENVYKGFNENKLVITKELHLS